MNQQSTQTSGPIKLQRVGDCSHCCPIQKWQLTSGTWRGHRVGVGTLEVQPLANLRMKCHTSNLTLRSHPLKNTLYLELPYFGATVSICRYRGLVVVIGCAPCISSSILWPWAAKLPQTRTMSALTSKSPPAHCQRWSSSWQCWHPIPGASCKFFWCYVFLRWHHGLRWQWQEGHPSRTYTARNHLEVGNGSILVTMVM